MRTVYKSAKEFITDCKKWCSWVLWWTESSVCDTTLWIKVHIISQTDAFITARDASAKTLKCVFNLKCFVWFVDICSQLLLESLLVVGWCTNRSLIFFFISDDETCISCYFCCVVYNSGGLFVLSWLLTIKKKLPLPFVIEYIFSLETKQLDKSKWDRLLVF